MKQVYRNKLTWLICVQEIKKASSACAQGAQSNGIQPIKVVEH